MKKNSEEDKEKSYLAKEIIRKAKEQIVSDEKKIYEKVSKFMKNLEKITSKIEGVRIMVGGSVGKGVFLSDVHDCDIFVRFDFDRYCNEDVSSILYNSLKWFGVKRIHGSRDYYQKKYEGMTYEIIPVLDIENWRNAKNTTDMSPLHVDWIKKKINEKPETKEEIMLLRSFFKANHLYGAESHIQGFSGHVLDILAINYCSFLKTIEEISKLKECAVIDVEKFYKTKKEAVESIDESKISPLIIIDPVMPSRNAGAAISKKIFEKAKEICRKFIETPSFESFKKEEIKIGTIIDNAKIPEKKVFVVVKAIPLNKKEDIAATKMIKAFGVLKKSIERNGFETEGFDWCWKKKYGFCWFIIDEEIPEKYVKEGPLKKMAEHSKRFVETNKDIFEKKGRFYSFADRDFTRPELFIKKFSRKKSLKDKIKSMKIFAVKKNKKSRGFLRI